MIVSCPACGARYKIDESKISVRGAKITCPRCSHKFVVFKDERKASDAPSHTSEDHGSDVPDDLGSRDFHTVGVQWKVRKGLGITLDVRDLDTLREMIDDDQVSGGDGLSYDGRDFRRIDDIDDLEELFWDVWRRAVKGELQTYGMRDASAEDEELDDAPTQLVGGGSELAEEIRKALEGTPAPAPSRAEALAAEAASAPRAAPAAPVAPAVESEPAPAAKAPEAAPASPAPSAPASAPRAPASAPSAPAPAASAPKPAAAPAAGGGVPMGLIIGGVVVVAVLVVVALFATGLLGVAASQAPDALGPLGVPGR